MAAIRKPETEWVKGKIDLSCSFLSKRLAPFVAAWESECSCLEHWQISNKIYQAKSRGLLAPIDAGIQAVCSVIESATRRNADCSPWAWFFYFFIIHSTVWGPDSDIPEILLLLEGNSLFCYPGMPCTEKIRSCETQWTFPLCAFLTSSFYHFRGNSYPTFQTTSFFLMESVGCFYCLQRYL